MFTPRFLAIVFVLLPAVAASQSLAEVARQEAERRKAIEKPGRVYTNADLGPEATRPPMPAVAAAPATAAEVAGNATAQPAGAPPPAAEPAEPVRDQAYWSARINAARQQLERSRMFAEALQSRINALTADFVNRDDPAQRDQIANDRAKALAELERVKQEIADQTKAIADIEEEARKAGVPPGWLRSA
ncbi:MAG: hypothetical protein AB1635_07565 [Acidobacteriota bacterium]